MWTAGPRRSKQQCDVASYLKRLIKTRWVFYKNLAKSSDTIKATVS